MRQFTWRDFVALMPTNVRRFFEKIDEALKLLGDNRDKKGRAVTIRDLETGDALAPLLPNGVRGKAAKLLGVPDGYLDTVPPEPPRNVTIASTGLTSVDLQWDRSPSRHAAYYEVLRAPTDQAGQAETVLVVRADASTDTYRATDPVGATGQTFYYWLRTISHAGVRGALHATNGLVATTGQVSAGDFDPNTTAIQIVDALPATASEGDVVFLRSNAKIYRYDGTQWTTRVDGDDIAANAVDWATHISGPGKPQDNADVTGLNTAADTYAVNGTAANVVATAVANFNADNDMDGSPINSTPTIATDGTAIDHVVNTDGSVDISFQWDWTGTESIDGFQVFVHVDTAATQYVFGTNPASEMVYTVPANSRALLLSGKAADKYYTIGIRAYRAVNTTIDASGVIASAIVKSTAVGEDPYRPSSNVAFAGDIIGTVAGVDSTLLTQQAADGAAAWGKFSGAGNTLPAGNVEFAFAGSSTKGGNALNTDAVGSFAAADVEASVLNYNTRNDRNNKPLTAPVVAAGAITHTLNTDGSANVSFQWGYAGIENDIDGFIIYAYRSDTAGTRTIDGTEPAYYVTPQHRAFTLEGVPADAYYQFGVRSYRIVDPDVAPGGALLSSIVQDGTTLYQPAANVAFQGVVGGATYSDGTPIDDLQPAEAGATATDPGNMIRNGAIIGSNDNFSTWGYDPDDGDQTKGCVYQVGNYLWKYSDQYVPVDTNKAYELAASFRTLLPDTTLYAGFACYDKEKRPIYQQHCWRYAGRDTTLYAAANAGDTTVQIVPPPAAWADPTVGSQIQFNIIADYSDLPNFDTYRITAIDTSTEASGYWTLTLGSALSSSFAAGTPVGNTTWGQTWLYPLLVNEAVGTSWTRRQAKISGTNAPTAPAGNYQFRRGTAYIRFMSLVGANQSDTTKVDDVLFIPLPDEQNLDALNLANGPRDPAATAGATWDDDISNQPSDQLIRNNQIDLSVWYDVDPLSSDIGVVDGSLWQRNQTAEGENRIVKATGPHGSTELIWECVASGNGQADGGWNYYHKKNNAAYAPRKDVTYRFSVWVKRVDTQDGSTYLGTTTSSGNGDGLAAVTSIAGTDNSNPYFWSGDLPQLNKWYLLVGYLHPVGYTGGQTDLSGVWDPETGKRVLAGNDFIMKSNLKVLMHRAYYYYSATVGARQQFARPRIDIVDGSEPSIIELLGAADNTRGAIESVVTINDQGAIQNASWDTGTKKIKIDFANQRIAIGDDVWGSTNSHVLLEYNLGFPRFEVKADANKFVRTDTATGVFELGPGIKLLGKSTYDTHKEVFEYQTTFDSIDGFQVIRVDSNYVTATSMGEDGVYSILDYDGLRVVNPGYTTTTYGVFLAKWYGDNNEGVAIDSKTIKLRGKIKIVTVGTFDFGAAYDLYVYNSSPTYNFIGLRITYEPNQNYNRLEAILGDASTPILIGDNYFASQSIYDIEMLVKHNYISGANNTLLEVKIDGAVVYSNDIYVPSLNYIRAAFFERAPYPPAGWGVNNSKLREFHLLVHQNV